MKNIPPFLMFRFFKLALQGRLHYQKIQNGKAVQGDENFVIFRKVAVDPSKNNVKKPEAVLKIYFKFARFSFTFNRFLSIIPIPFIASQPGFRSKTWLFCRETGVFQGLYEWDSIKDAENYMNSFVVRLMKSRSMPGTLKYEITERINHE